MDNVRLRKLRGLCHQLSPVVIVADKGLTENVNAEIELALDSHQLIKVKLRGERDQRADWIRRITESTGAELVQKIGQVACFYRRNPEKPQISLH
ncbi:MAG: YhbY family RNA-binding protein [Wenzhouxiangellaceae bacterium]